MSLSPESLVAVFAESYVRNVKGWARRKANCGDKSKTDADLLITSMQDLLYEPRRHSSLAQFNPGRDFDEFRDWRRGSKTTSGIPKMTIFGTLPRNPVKHMKND
jgi:hypothetical protein